MKFQVWDLGGQTSLRYLNIIWYDILNCVDDDDDDE